MNRSIALYTAFAFLLSIALFHLVYALVNFTNRKIPKKWIWTRLALSLVAMAATTGFAYIFFLNQ